MNTTWKPVTLTDEKPASDGIDFVMTPAERDIAVMAMAEILEKQRPNFTPGIVVRHVDPAELTAGERAKFGLVGGAK